MNIRLIRVAVCAFALLALGVVGADSASRNWNLRQKTDGTTVWKENTPGAANEVRVDRRFLTLALADIGAAATGHVVVPDFGNAGTYYVSKIYSVTHTAVTGTTVIYCGIGSGAATGTATNYRMTSGSISHTVAASAAGATNTATPTANNSVASGGVIHCGSDGVSDAAAATITFQIDGNF
jgi:hypothetical protein